VIKIKYLKLLIFILISAVLFIVIVSGLFQKQAGQSYEAIETEAIRILYQQDPREAITYFKTKTIEANFADCHDVMHKIGEESFKKYGDFAKVMEYQDPLCTGYIHGVIQGYFATVKDPNEAIKTVCQKYPQAKFQALLCQHSVGHVLMYYSNNDLPKSLEACSKLASGFDRSACTGGVYMENFNADPNLHPSQYLKDDDLFYPCNSFGQYKEQCYIHAPYRFLENNNDDYDSALNWCKQTEEQFRGICIAGVVAQAAIKNLDEPKFAESICEKAESKYTGICIEEIPMVYISYFASLEKGKEVCKIFEEENKSACEKAVTNFSLLF